MSNSYIDKEGLSKVISNIKNSNAPSVFISPSEPETTKTGDIWLISDINILIESIKTPLLETGSISSSTGLNTTSDTAMRTAGYLEVTPGNKYYFENNTTDGKRMRIFFYDVNKEPILNWFTESGGNTYSYKNITNGGSFEIPTDISVKYMKIRIDAVESNLTISVKGIFPN